MAHSLELRTPLVDSTLLTEIAEFMSYLPSYPNKSILSNSPLQPLPSEIQKRKKTGFSTPVNSWLENYDELEIDQEFNNHSSKVARLYEESIKDIS